MRMTRQQMDELINQHFGFEAADDLEGEGVTPLRRFYGEDFVVDETL